MHLLFPEMILLLFSVHWLRPLFFLLVECEVRMHQISELPKSVYFHHILPLQILPDHFSMFDKICKGSHGSYDIIFSGLVQ